MKIDVFDIKEFIDLNNLEEITSPILFQRGNVPDPKGLISNEIFGVDVRSRKWTFAYINLHGHFFNPHIYKAFRRLWRNIDKVVNGDYFYNIDENGLIYKDDEHGRTGIENIYKDWNKINWEKTSGMRNERIDLLTKTKKNVVFMDYQLVIPAFYRDVSLTGSGGETSELNNMYSKLIRLAGVLEDRDMFDFTIHSTYYNMQNLIISIYDYFKVKLEKKNGLIRRYLMGKNTDYCTRSVISAPIFHADSPDHMETDFEHVGIPISQVCSLCYPFMAAWLKSWFENEFITNQETKLIHNGDGTVKIKNPEAYFTDEYIKKMMNRYIRDPEFRFSPIKVPLENGKWGKVAFTGIRYDKNDTSDQSSIQNRPLTVTDLLYMAAYDVTKDKHALITRYPVSDSYGLFIGKIRVISTIKTEICKVGETIYEYYPSIEVGMPEREIATRFKETVIFSSSYLEGIGGDYDGDQVTIKIIWTQEANEEVQSAMESPNFFITATGSNIREIGKEGLQTIYMMTKDSNDKSKVIRDPDTLRKFLNRPAEDYTFTFFNDTFANRRVEDKILRSRYQTNDIVEIPANFNAGENWKFKNTTAIKTTLGRIFFNKIIIEGCGMENVIGFVNRTLAKKSFYALEAEISSHVKEGNLTTKQMRKYIDHRDWMGYQFYAVICASFTEKTLSVPPEVKALKKQLLTKYKKELEAGDEKVCEDIENQLIKKTEELLDDDPGMDFFKSGSKLSTGNNLKNITLMRGAVMNPVTGEYDIITNSFLDGMEKDKFAAHSNALVMGAYPKAVGTADSGYLSKQLSAAMQTQIIDKDGSNCGTTKTLSIHLSSKNKGRFMYRNIKVGANTVMLTPENIDKFIGKEVQMYSPMFCTHEKICARCAGRYDNKFIGLDTNKIATTLTNLNMKKFHDSTIKTEELDPKSIFLLNKKQGVLSSDGKNIILEDSYMELYIPEYFFSPSYKFAEDLGDKYNLFGIVNVGIFSNGKLSYIDTLNCPANLMINVFEMEYREVVLPDGKTPCRVVKYYKKNKLFKNFIVKDSTNAQLFLRSITYGKLPSSIPYSHSAQFWDKNQSMNDVSFGVPSIIEEVVLRVMYRNPANLSQTYAQIAGLPNSKVGDYGYKMVSVRTVCQYASTFSAITFEDFDAMVTTSVNREREHKSEVDSPVENLFKM